MNPKIDSYLRHVFTAWITAAVVALTAWFALDDESVQQITKGFGQIGEGVLIVLAVVAPALGRLLWAWLAKVFRSGSGELGNDPKGGSGGGLPCILLLCGMAGLLGLGLPSCAALSAVPIKASVLVEEGTLSYSSKGGLEMEYRPGYGRMPAVYAAK
jgi:hypothetical protein